MLNRVIDIDFVKNPLCVFGKGKENILIEKEGYVWGVEYNKGVLNEFDYRLLQLLIDRQYPFDKYTQEFSINEIVIELGLEKGGRLYDRIVDSIDKMIGVSIYAKNRRISGECKFDRKKLLEHRGNLITQYDLYKEGAKNIYKIEFDKLLIDNVRNGYRLYCPFDFKNEASCQLYYYIVLHRHDNKELLLSVDKICEILQTEKYKEKKRILDHYSKYFKEIVELSGEIKKYDLYKSSKKWIYKLIYGDRKVSKVIVDSNNGKVTDDYLYYKLNLSQYIKMVKQIRKENKEVWRWKSKEVRRGVIKKMIMEKIRGLE